MKFIRMMDGSYRTDDGEVRIARETQPQYFDYTKFDKVWRTYYPDGMVHNCRLLKTAKATVRAWYVTQAYEETDHANELEMKGLQSHSYGSDEDRPDNS